MDIITVGLIVLCLLQFADAFTTKQILTLGGVELNPVMKWLFDAVGVSLTLVLKIVLVVGCSILSYFFYPISVDSDAALLLLAACIFYIGIVINNVIVILRLRLIRNHE